MQELKLSDVDYDYIEDILEIFKMNKIKVIKYNNTLDDEAFKYPTYNAFMELSLDGEQLFITNKVKYKDKEYVLENDPSEI